MPLWYKKFVLTPFFTTKGVGKGTGQGPAIARTTIVETHRGSITFTTEPGVGTTFIILPPLSRTGAAGVN
jgi:two-component system, NtrC family, sensor kinase